MARTRRRRPIERVGIKTKMRELPGHGRHAGETLADFHPNRPPVSPLILGQSVTH
jgi:hypothetical protein